MIGFNGGLVGINRVYTASSPNAGVWTLNEHVYPRRGYRYIRWTLVANRSNPGVTQASEFSVLMLYSFRQQRPAPLPNRIRLSNGFTRYAHQPPTAEEILDAGYVAYTEPAYDAATEQLLWVDGAYVIEALPPPIPTPRWVDFSAIVMSLPAINVMLGAVLQAAPGLYGGMWLACTNASEGDSRVFLNSWNAAFAMGLLSAELITTVQEIAGEYDLPESFIDALG
jgi:hypothetical protein